MSGRQQGESRGIPKKKTPSPSQDPAKGTPPAKGGRRHRSADLGRALRSVYDDTLRESVPDDFLDLLGKLN